MKSHKSLRNVLIGNFLTVIAVSFAIIGGIAIFISENYVDSEVSRNNQQLSYLLIAQIEDYLDQAESDLRFVQNTIQYNKLTADEINNLLKTQFENHQFIVKLQVADQHGLVQNIYPASSEFVHVDISKRPYFIETQRSYEVTWSSTFISPQINQPVVTVSAPLDGGVVTSFLSLDKIGAIIDQINLRKGAFVTVTDRKAIFVAHSDEEQVMQREHDFGYDEIRRSYNGIPVSQTVTYKGADYIRYTDLLVDKNWAISIYQPMSAVYRPVKNIIIAITTSFTLIAFLIVMIALFTVKKVTGSLKIISDKAKIIAGGHYDVTIPDNRFSELNELGSQFNKMAQEIKQRENQKKQFEAALRKSQKLEAMGTLAGGIAHDFNNIIAVILGYTELVLDNVPEKSEEHENLEKVIQAADRAKNLVEQILTFSRKSMKDRQKIHLKPVIDEAALLLRKIIPATIEIDTTGVQEVDKTVYANSTQINQVVMNLCINAYHAMETDGGKITITLRSLKADQGVIDRFTDLREGWYAHLTIADTGGGIEHRYLERIFDPFFTTKENHKGSGLGLSVVHGIIASHGGFIGVESRVGLGTMFEIFFPLVDESSDGDVALNQRAEDRAIKGSGHVLLVDDELDLLKIGKRALLSLGYQVTALSSPLEALEQLKIEQGLFDILLTDQSMPGMSGVQLAREVKKLRPGLPVIVVSGYSNTLTEESIKASGVNAVLMKPYKKVRLAETLRAVLSDITESRLS